MTIKKRKSIGDLWIVEIETCDLPVTRVESILLLELSELGTLIRVDAAECRVAIRSSMTRSELEEKLEETVDESSVLLSASIVYAL